MQKEFVIQNFKLFRPYLVAHAPLEHLYTGVGRRTRLFRGPPRASVQRCAGRKDLPLRRGASAHRILGSLPATPTATPTIGGGRLLTCESGNRRVTRTEYDGAVTILAQHYDGKRLNSPNDIVVSSDDAVWLPIPITESSAITPETRRRARSGGDPSSHRPEERRCRDRDRRAWQTERPCLFAR